MYFSNQVCDDHRHFNVPYEIRTLTSELYASAPNEVKLKHFKMNTNDAYNTNTAEIVTTSNDLI